jgi:hypothetical protein
MKREPELLKMPAVSQVQTRLAPYPAHHLEVVRRLVAAMVLGRLYRRAEDVLRIFDAASQMLDDDRPLHLCLAFGSAMTGDPAPARALLADSAAGDEHEALALLALALALKNSDDPGWRQVVYRVLAHGPADEAARRYGQRLLTHESISREPPRPALERER